jgi:hypothetical protein
MILPRRRDLLACGAWLLVPKAGRAAMHADARSNDTPGPQRPAAVAGTNWAQKSNWNFGTAAGNNVRRFTDLPRDGWFMNPTPTWLNNECQTYNTTDLTDGNLNFMPFSDHCDIVAIWNGGPIESAKGNGSISSLAVLYDVPFPRAIGYYESTCKIPSVSGAWPAWWTLGHRPGTPQGSNTWGPEIDIFEFNDTKTRVTTSTLHGSRSPSYCFLKSGGNPPRRNESPAARGEAHPWNMGSFEYQPGVDFAQGYHRFGAKIAPNYNISIWVDDVAVGVFEANQYSDDVGNPVVVQLVVNLALGTNNPDPVRSIRTADFGGPHNRGEENKFRVSLKNIQIWGP